MPKSRHTWVIGSPPKRRATNRRRSSITELSFHGIHTLRKKAESVTHVSGTECHLCLGPLINHLQGAANAALCACGSYAGPHADSAPQYHQLRPRSVSHRHALGSL